jgi:membrane protease YdiL (CAAX protease family)
MSRAPTRPVDRTAPAAWILVVAGLAAMLLRPQISVLAGSPRIIALAAVWCALLAACLLVPIAPDRERPHMSPMTGTLIGLGAIVLATLVSGPVVRVPFAAWALPLSVLAAVAEEALFRRVAYGWLARWGVPVAIVGSAVLFAAVHVPLYGTAVLPVDLGAGLLLGWQRWATGTWTVPAVTHAAANVLATVMR